MQNWKHWKNRLEALEKQIEQQEVEEKQKAEAAAKSKAAVEKQRLEEIKRIAEEKRMAEEARLAELERQRQEEEAKKRAEEQRLAEEETERLNAIPNISGTWTGIADGGTKTSSKYIINQDGSKLQGRYVDELLDGRAHSNGSIYGTVDNVGNVNITIDFGRLEVKPGDKRVVKSFNKLKLSINGNELTGEWTNTLGSSGSVQLVKE